MSKETTGFSAVLSGIVNNKKGTASIEVVSKNSKVDVDSWANKKIDIADAEKFGNGKYMSTASILGHSLAEQESLQIENKDNPDRSVASYFRDHEKGCDAEGTITGFKRSPGEGDATWQNLLGNTSGDYRFSYYDENQPKPVIHHVVVTFKNGNIKKSTTED
jgi:hypothetical protein